jgi:hypothetical protein
VILVPLSLPTLARPLANCLAGFGLSRSLRVMQPLAHSTYSPEADQSLAMPDVLTAEEVATLLQVTPA